MIRATGGSPVASARWCLRPSHSAMSLCASLRSSPRACACLLALELVHVLLALARQHRALAVTHRRARFLSSLSSSFSAAAAASAFCVANVWESVRRARGGDGRAARGDGRLRRRGNRVAASRPRRRGGNRRRGRPRARRGAGLQRPGAEVAGHLQRRERKVVYRSRTPRARDTARGEKRRNGRCLATWWASSRAWRAVAVMKGKAGCGGQTRAVKVGWARCAARERRPSAFVHTTRSEGRVWKTVRRAIGERDDGRGRTEPPDEASVATSRVAAPASAVPEAGGMLRAPHDWRAARRGRLEHSQAALRPLDHKSVKSSTGVGRVRRVSRCSARLFSRARQSWPITPSGVLRV